MKKIDVWAAARVPWIQADVATKYLMLGYEPFHASDNFIFLRKKVAPKKTKKVLKSRTNP